MIDSLVGALIGGFFAILGGWCAVRWQADDEARGIAASLLAELSTTEAIMTEGGGRAFYQKLIAQWKETGEVESPDMLVDLFENNPQESFPVYFAVAPKLGSLPTAIAADLVRYHAKIIGLLRIVVRFLGKYDFEEASVKKLALSIEDTLAETDSLRSKLIKELKTFANRSFRFADLLSPQAGGRAPLP